MGKPFRTYQTKEEWEHQARALLLFGVFCGLVIGAGLASFIFLLSLGMK